MNGERPEFSRVVSLARLGGDPFRQRIAADAAERAALARRFELVSLDRLEAEIELAREPGGTILLSAAFEAEFAQECIVTLEPVPARIAEDFTVLYGETEAARDIVLDGEADPVEPLEGGRIDIGEAVAQQLSLSLDPFPRAPE